MDRKGTQPYIYMYPFSPKLTSHLGCHIKEGNNFEVTKTSANLRSFLCHWTITRFSWVSLSCLKDAGGVHENLTACHLWEQCRAMVTHIAMGPSLLGSNPQPWTTLLTDVNFSVPRFLYLQNRVNVCKALKTVPVDKVSHHHPHPHSLYMKVM